MHKVVIMRGPSGSGKTTIANSLLEKHSTINRTICSADEFRMVDGEYVFKPQDTGVCHQKCYAKFIKVCGIAYECEDSCLIIVDNTNIKQWEFRPYVTIAKKIGFDVDYEIPEGDWIAEELAARNTHGTPAETIQRMIDSFEANI